MAGFGVYRLRSELLTGRLAGPVEARVFWEAWNRVEDHFFGDVPSPRARTYGAIHNSLTLLDPHTSFIAPAPRQLEKDRLRGAYGGIGVTIWRKADGAIALAPYPNSPAERAGLVRGDVLLAVDGELLPQDLPESDVQVKLRGEVGSLVRLTVSRSPGSSFQTIIDREQIDVPSVTWHMETATSGYVHLTRFTQRTDSELSTALKSLRDADATGLILDLRGNPGGLLESAMAVASRFLEAGDVVLSEAGRTGSRSFTAAGQGDLATALVVLVDGGTASAAEIVAGALQDHDRAPLMGEPTFGKGSVQQIYDLSDGSSLHVTTAIWLTPDHHRIDGQGLRPDVIVAMGNGPGDETLSRAVAYLESE